MMKIDPVKLFMFATKVPAIVTGAMHVVEQIKGAKGAEKKAAVLAAVPESIELAEFAAGKDLLNDDVVKGLLEDYIEAEHALMSARKRLQQGILAKQAAA